MYVEFKNNSVVSFDVCTIKKHFDYFMYLEFRNNLTASFDVQQSLEKNTWSFDVCRISQQYYKIQSCM